MLLHSLFIKNKQDDEVIYEKIDSDAAEETDSGMEDTTENSESQLDNEGLGNVDVHSTENTELITTESVVVQIKDSPVENSNIEEEMDFDDLTIPDNYSDCDILEEEKEPISLNDEV